MPTQEQRKSAQPTRAARWWLALMGVVLFSITVASYYSLQHIVLGVFIVIAIHLLMALFTRVHAADAESAARPSRLSDARTLILLLPLAVLGVLGILVGGSSVWHAYFCALAIGSFTAMCWVLPSRRRKKDGTPAPESSQI